MSDAADPTAIFHEMYRAAAGGGPGLPWDRGAPHPLLEPWARDLDGAGRRALVVGSGLGTDAEYIAARDFDVTGFDVSPTAIEMARERFPGSAVEYRVANLLELPAEWAHAFDLVVEIYTVQSMPIELHAPATASIARTVAGGGTLLVIATGRRDPDVIPDGPPWPLTRAEVEAFAGDGLEAERVEPIVDPGGEDPPRWRATFRRHP
jgi:SAM-dependent methyltransferase